MEASYQRKTRVVNELLSGVADVSLQDNVRILYQLSDVVGMNIHAYIVYL